MPLDAICLSALTQELRLQLIGARIDKINQPERDELGFALRSPKLGNVRLLLSANQRNARVHLTAHSRENPQSPPMFCMLLRKHLTGARILDITQPPFERLLQFSLEAVNDFGERVTRTFVAEIMGKNSNFILVDENNRVIDCLKRVDYEMSEKRPVLPGLFYHLPPPQSGKQPPGRDMLLDVPCEEKALLSRICGISPFVAREIERRGSAEFLLDILETCKFAPHAVGNDFTYFECPGSVAAESFSALLDEFFTNRDAAEHLQKRSADLRRTVKNAADRIRRKLALQADELAQTKNRDELRKNGDLLMANLHNIPRGAKSVRLENFYDDCKPVEIALDPALSAHQNASKLYKSYSKAKNAEEMLAINMQKGASDLEYIESVLDSLDKIACEADILSIRAELEQTGYLPKPKVRKKIQTAAPMVFDFEGLKIYVGRNNRQNDELTLKVAEKRHFWLHAQKIAGSHVIIASEQPGDRAIEFAAKLAAKYSQAKTNPKVPVDYTRVKYVRKAQNGKPGMVIYDKFKTVTVDPQG